VRWDVIPFTTKLFALSSPYFGVPGLNNKPNLLATVAAYLLHKKHTKFRPINQTCMFFFVCFFFVFFSTMGSIGPVEKIKYLKNTQII